MLLHHLKCVLLCRRICLTLFLTFIVRIIYPRFSSLEGFVLHLLILVMDRYDFLDNGIFKQVIVLALRCDFTILHDNDLVGEMEEVDGVGDEDACFVV